MSAVSTFNGRSLAKRHDGILGGSQPSVGLSKLIQEQVVACPKEGVWTLKRAVSGPSHVQVIHEPPIKAYCTQRAFALVVRPTERSKDAALRLGQAVVAPNTQVNVSLGRPYCQLSPVNSKHVILTYIMTKISVKTRSYGTYASLVVQSTLRIFRCRISNSAQSWPRTGDSTSFSTTLGFLFTLCA
jgi:hypothetical protein